MVYTPVGWANDTTHPLSQANMKTLDAGIVGVDADLATLDGLVASLRPVAATNTTTGTRTNTAYGPTLNDSASGPSASVTVPASGVVTVHMQARCSVDAGSGYASFAVGGENTQSASDSRAIRVSAASGDVRYGITHLLTGLSAGQTTFTINYRNTNTGAVSTWLDRHIVVVPHP